MHKLTLIGLLVLLPSISHSKMLCSAFFAKRLKRQVERVESTDKWKHCALSCMLARRCGGNDSFMLGILKELADVVGPGNAEWADLVADSDGVMLWRLGMGRTDSMCKENCASLYPHPIEENACHLPSASR